MPYVTIGLDEEVFEKIFSIWEQRTVIPDTLDLEYSDKQGREKIFPVDVEIEDIKDIARKLFLEEVDPDILTSSYEEIYDEYAYLFRSAFSNYESDLQDNVYSLVREEEDNDFDSLQDERYERWLEENDDF